MFNFSELFAKQRAESIKNGTVGNIGKTAPTDPNARDKQPMMVYIIFDNFNFLSPILIFPF